MTQNTEQERATREDFEHWATSTNQGYDLTRNQSGRMQTYECVKTEHAWRGFFNGWQAARRAPVVPQFNQVAQKKLNYLLEAGEEITGYAIQNKYGRRGAIDCHGFVYWWQDAAAPQPPGFDVQKRTTKPEAAPVQMPEALARIEGGSLKWHIPDAGYSLPAHNLKGTHNLYTEQQVRQLLAAHGVK